MELDKIIPLQETPKTPYQTSIAVPILRFRWIHAQCFQFELAHRLLTQMNLER